MPAVNRLLKNTVAPLTGAFSTLRSASFPERCSNPSLDLKGAFSTLQRASFSERCINPSLAFKSGSKSAEPNTVETSTEKNPNLHLHPQPNSEESANVHVEPNNEKDLNIHRECDSGGERPESEIITLWGSYRVRGGKVQELRNNGMVPGIVSDYHAEKGNNYTYYIALQRKEIWGHLTRMGRKDFTSRFYNLALRDRPDSDQIEHTVKVYPSKLYLLEGRRSILNMAFVRVRHNVKLRMIIPLKFRGRTVCPGLIKGGTLVVLKKAVSIFVYPDEVPPYIEVDVSTLQVGERILFNDLDVDLQHTRQAGHVVCEVKKYRFVRPNRSRSLARSSPDIGPPKYAW